MVFRPVEPRGDVFDAMRHWAAFLLMLLLSFAVVGVQLYSMSAFRGAAGPQAFVAYAIGYVQLLFLPLSGMGVQAWIPLGAAILLAFLLHFVFYLSLMTMLARTRALSLANVMVGATVLAAAIALLPVLTGYGSVNPRYRLPLLEDYAYSFLVYAIAFDLGGLFEWVCLRTAPATGTAA